MTLTQHVTRTRSAFLAAIRANQRAWITVVVLSVALLLVPAVFRLDGKPHADWQQFLGRFHPLAVHIPIGLIVLVPVLEIAGAWRPALRDAATFVLSLACAACIGTLILGYMLAFGSGDSGLTVSRHMWGGIGLTVGLMFCLLMRPLWSSGMANVAYPAMLCCAMLLLFWTAHQGGSLTHGEDYLTRYMPAPLRRIVPFGLSNTAVSEPDSFYSTNIHPIFDSNCVSCHGASKTDGNLRLDTYAALMKGGKDGAVVVPRDEDKSVLIARITLPSGDVHAMPAEGRPPLKPAQIAMIRAWIRAGASPSDKQIAGFVVAAGPTELPIEPVGDYSRLSHEIEQLQHSQGAKLLPVSSKPSDGLVLNTVDVAGLFGDAQLAQFEKFAPFIVEADLARTTITDASFETLAKFTHLRALHLEGTNITGSGLAKLSSLHQLAYLNLSETKVTDAFLAPTRAMANLRHVYLFDTPAQPAPSAAEANKKAGETR